MKYRYLKVKSKLEKINTSNPNQYQSRKNIIFYLKLKLTFETEILVFKTKIEKNVYRYSKSKSKSEKIIYWYLKLDL